METLILSFVLMLMVILAMSVGVLMGRKPIKGSCGGLANIGIDGKCSICGADREDMCDTEEEGLTSNSKASSDLAYDASKQNNSQ